MPTSAKHKKLPERIDRPFDKQILRRAKAIAEKYRVSLWREDGEWYGECVEQPGAMGDGRTMTIAAKATREAATAIVAYQLETDKPVATPIVDQDRRRAS